MPIKLTSYSEITDLMRGSVDMHMHFGPDPLFPRRIDAAQAARDAQEAGMLAFVLKVIPIPRHRSPMRRKRWRRTCT